jgi:hypothetical protein
MNEQERSRQACIAAIFRITTASDRANATLDFQGREDVLSYMDEGSKLMHSGIAECREADEKRLHQMFVDKMTGFLKLFHSFENMALTTKPDSPEFEMVYDRLMEILIIFSLTADGLEFGHPSYKEWRHKKSAFTKKIIALAREEFGPKS